MDIFLLWDLNYGLDIFLLCSKPTYIWFFFAELESRAFIFRCEFMSHIIFRRILENYIMKMVKLKIKLFCHEIFLSHDTKWWARDLINGLINTYVISAVVNTVACVWQLCNFRHCMWECCEIVSYTTHKIKDSFSYHLQWPLL